MLIPTKPFNFDIGADSPRLEQSPMTNLLCQTPQQGSPNPAASSLTLTDAQIQELLGHSKQDPNVYEVVTILLNTGIRPGEFKQLPWTDIDFDGDKITIRSGNHMRQVPFDSETKKVLQARLSRQQPTAEFVLGARPEAVLSRVQRSLKRLALQLGIPSGHFRILRHTWASRLASMGMDLPVLAYLGGWSLSTSYHMLFRVSPASAAKSYRAAFRP